MGMRTSTCRGCGAVIGFIETVARKTIPVNPEEVAYEQKAGGSLKIVTPNGEVLSAERPADPQKATGIGYISHFATCPAADYFRKPKKRSGLKSNIQNQSSL